ncbi:hypothetical protein SEPCBS119000_004819 [Sporothrix epigloea]|uniref:Uncharacterized protein n=1 Tax=Sporothrix epigloea TaxID=1892477 RepID=A0ABP0DU75_9PEZI
MAAFPYHASPRLNGPATPMNQYSYNSYSATAQNPEQSTASPSTFPFVNPVNGRSHYMDIANRQPQPSPAYPTYQQHPPVVGHLHRSQSIVSPVMPQSQYSHHSGRSPRNGLERTPQMPAMSSLRQRIPSVGSATDSNRTPRTRPCALNNFPESVNGYPITASRSGSTGELLSGDFAAAITLESRNAVLAPGEDCELHQDCAPDDRLICNLHRRHRDARGKGMWDLISSEFHKEYPDRKLSTARLQMKHTRAFSAMVKIYMEEEKKKYESYATRLKKVIGDKYWDFKAADVEAFLSRTGIEDAIPEQTSKTRRRNHAQGRRFRESDAGKSSASYTPNPWNPSHVSSPAAGRQQLPLPDSNQTPMAESFNYKHNMLASIPTPVLSQEQEVVFLDSLDQKYGQIEAEQTAPSSHSNSPANKTSGTPDAAGFQKLFPSPNSNQQTTNSNSPQN